MGLIQNTRYAKKTNPIQFENLSLMPVGGNIVGYSQEEEVDREEVDKEEATDPAELTSNKDSYIDALERTKTTARERAGFLFDKPKAPEMDEEQRKRFKNLTKAGALAQLVDAVGDIAMGSKNKDYRPAPIAADELAFSGLQQVYNMDERQRQELDQYKDQVFQIGNQNKRIGAEIDKQNEQTDVDVAKARLGFEEKNEAEKKADIRYKEQQDRQDKQWYENAALRMMSNGEPESAMEFAKLSGKSVEEARKFLGIDSSGGDKSATILDYYNDLYGRSGEDSITKGQLLMMQRYRELNESITDDDVPSTVKPEGSKKYQELQALGKELGALRYAPSEDEVLKIYGKGKKESSVNPDNQWRMDRDGLIDPETGKPEANKLNLPKLGKIEPNSKESLSQIESYSKNAIQIFNNAKTQEEKRALAEKVEKDLRGAGLEDSQIEEIGGYIFGGERKPNEQSQSVNPETKAKSGQGAGMLPKNYQGKTPQESYYRDMPKGLSREEFAQKLISETVGGLSSMGGYNSDSSLNEKVEDATKSSLSVLNDDITYLRNILGSTLKAPVDIWNKLRDAQKQKIEKEYRKYLDSQ